MALISRSFKSKSSDALHVAQYDPATGQSSCTCAGWRFKKPTGERSCPHTRELIAETPADLPPDDPEPDPQLPPPATRRAAVPPPPPPQPAAGGGLNPMLASAMTGGKTLAEYTTDQWVLEPKLDGHRCIVRHAGGEFGTVTAWSRPRASAGSDVGLERPLPPAIVAALLAMPNGVYDGELCAPSGKAWDVTRVDLFPHLQLVLFDLVEVNGASILAAPYAERREGLAVAMAHVPDQRAVVMTPAVPVSQAAIDALLAAGGEGAVLKRLASPYRPGYRTGDWIKVKPMKAATLTITGFEAGSYGPHSVVLLRADDGAETRVKTKDNEMLRLFATNPPAFIGRRAVISYQERIAGKAYRHPMLKGLLDHLAGEAE